MTVSQMTTEELQEMLETVIEQKLAEWLDTDDTKLQIKESVRNRLLRQKEELVAMGERGQEFLEVAQRLGLE